jgi:hypothetical protein
LSRAGAAVTQEAQLHNLAEVLPPIGRIDNEAQVRKGAGANVVEDERQGDVTLMEHVTLADFPN